MGDSTRMTPDETRAALDAAERYQHATMIDEVETEADTMATFLLAHRSALLALAEGAGAEDGIKRPVSAVYRPDDYALDWIIEDDDGQPICSCEERLVDAIKAALNRPAPGAGELAKEKDDRCEDCGAELVFMGWSCPGGTPESITEDFGCPACRLREEVRELEEKILKLSAAPGAGAGIFEGGSIDYAFSLLRAGRFTRNSEMTNGVALGMNPPFKMIYLFRGGGPREPAQFDLADTEIKTWVECDRHGNPLPVPQPPSAPTAGDGQGVTR